MTKHEQHIHQQWENIGIAINKGSYLSFHCDCGRESRMLATAEKTKGKFLHKLINSGKLIIKDERT